MSSRGPLIKSTEIEKGMKRAVHPVNPDAVRYTASLGDMAGMRDMGLHRCRLDPHTESTVIHYHLNTSEWIYILSGTGTIQLVDSSLPPKQIQPPYPITEHPVGPGDFLGFSVESAPSHAHCLKAGSEGLEYICGGTKTRLDGCVYPQLNKTLFHNDIDNVEFGMIEGTSLSV